MARYDRGYEGPRGGWRGQGSGMGGRGFPGPKGPPFGPGGQPFGGGGYGGMGGGGWSRGPDSPGPGGFGPGRPGFGGHGPSRPGFGGPGGFPGGPRGGWDRGEYGGAYEEYGGYPGGPGRGEYYGGPGAGQGPARGYDRGWGGGYAREPFMPEEAYQRHPEYRQDRQPREWEAHQREYGDEEPDDDEVRDAVYRRMSADAWVDADRIEVQVEDGVVTLTGEVDDFMEARYAWDDAWEADGVRGVVNNLTVRADQPQEAHGDIVVQGAGGRTTVGEPTEPSSENP